MVDPLVSKVMQAPQEMLFSISPVFDYPLEPHKDSFATFVCESCGEMTIERYGRISGDRKVCIDCAG